MTIRNGSIVGFEHGIDLLGIVGVKVHNVRAFDNTDEGIRVGDVGIVTNSVAVGNGRGIAGGRAGIYRDDVVSGNLAIGLDLGGSNRLEGSIGSDNGSTGIEVACPSILVGNTARDNGQVDIVLTGQGCIQAQNNFVP